MHLEVVLGPMFSGKSTYIHTAIHRRRAIGQRTLVIKPKLDTRHSVSNETATHDGIRIPCRSVAQLSEVSSCELTDVAFVVVEEAQFFTDLLPWILDMEGSCSDKSFLIIGLSGDSNRRPFGQMLDILPYADSIVHMNALCMRCRNGTPAAFSHRRNDSTSQIAIGGEAEYETLCRRCYLRAPSQQRTDASST
jgi:thymidine kinase